MQIPMRREVDNDNNKRGCAHQLAMRSLACSTLVPCRRMTMGFFMPIDLAALMTPVAITSHLMMPPKMFTKIVSTFETTNKV